MRTATNISSATARSWPTAAGWRGGRTSPRATLRVLGDVDGQRRARARLRRRAVVDRACAAGARPVGLELSERQLEHARRLMAEAGVDFPLVNASAEAVPLPDASFDIVFCDHGAMSFADPYRTVPEAARLLRPGGQFAFNHHSPIQTICWPLEAEEVGERLALDYFGMHASTTARTSRSSCPTGSGSGCSGQRLLHRGPHRASTRGRRDELVSVRHRAGMGAAMAGGVHLAAAPRVRPAGAGGRVPAAGGCSGSGRRLDQPVQVARPMELDERLAPSARTACRSATTA